MPIRIKKAKMNDLEKLYNIEKECFTLEAFSKEQIASLLQNHSSISLLAQINDKVVGFVIAFVCERENKKVCHILTLDVALQARRKGVGSKLLKSLEQNLLENGIKVCCLEVKADNKVARELYRRLGYVEIEVLKDFYYPGGHGRRLKKILK